MIRRLLIIPIILAVLVGGWSGLVRIGWEWPVLHESWVQNHGLLLVPGFLGTVIGLERAATFGKKMAFVGPILSATAVLSLVLGISLSITSIMMIGAAIIMTGVNLIGPLGRDRLNNHALVVIAGSLMWLAGNLFWALNFSDHVVTLFWVGFLSLTICGERLELSRFSRPGPQAQALFRLFAVLPPLGAFLSVAGNEFGPRVVGAGLILLAGWLIRYDVGRRLRDKVGLSRYMALTLTSAYAWMMVSGLSWLYHGPLIQGPIYDGTVHSFFIGFVLVMIFAHAPMIIPAIVSTKAVFHRMLYLPMMSMHISLGIRFIGDLLGQSSLQQWGSLLNAAAVLLFITMLAGLARGLTFKSQ